MAKLPCPPELWPAFSALLDEALDTPDAERQHWLDGLGAEHAEIKPWLVKVLATGTKTDANGFLEAVVIGETPPEFVAGQLIGPYQLKKRLGSGGMGEVWLASRSDGTLTRQVAFKLPHIHLLAGVVRRRFERERDILAALAHPRIAHLYDAGVDEAQNPYLAMEYVDGIAINDYCRDAKVSLDRRLKLFLQVLDAVGHAHGRLIAHRDLKPSNILVTPDERVKLLDFGIAKLLDGDAERGATQMTRMGACMATPAYAAPEQLAGEPITVAVDLYALGVILHELLTGQRPYRDNRKTSAERTQPVRASARVETAHAEYVGGLQPKQLRQALTGDLDAIISKALEVDPADRYASAEAFAQDIRRSRDHRPISAVRLTRTTLAMKFLRRHWVGSAMTAAFMLTIIGGSIAIAWQAVRAEREAARATTIKDFLIGVFRASDPRIAADKPRGEITARELLDVSAKNIEAGFAHEPATQLELLGVTAEIYNELDEMKRSTALYARETELATKALGADDVHAIEGILGQANNADVDGDDALALSLLEKADPLIHRAGLDRTAFRARWLLTKGEAMMNDAARQAMAREALEDSAKLFRDVAPGNAHYPDVLVDLGTLAFENSQSAASASYYRQVIAIVKGNSAFEGSLLLAYAGLALALEHMGDFPGAADAFKQGAAVAIRTYGASSRDYRLIAAERAQFLYERGEREKALSDFEALAHELPSEVSAYHDATDASEAAQLLRKFGYCLSVDGQPARALELLARGQALLKIAAKHPLDYARLQLALGEAYRNARQFADASEAFSRAVESMESNAAPADALALAHERRGRLLLDENKWNDAAHEFSEAMRLSEHRSTETNIRGQAGMALVELGRGNQKAAWDASQRALEKLDHIEGYYDVRLLPYVWTIRLNTSTGPGSDPSLIDMLTRAREAIHKEFSPSAPEVAEIDGLLSKSLQERSAH